MRDTKYDVKINRQGYILRPGSYIRKKMPLASEQFRTGDVEYSNLNAWEYFGQSDWSGGAGQTQMVDPAKFQYAQGIKISDKGEIKLADSMESLSFQGSLHHTGLKLSTLWYLGGSAGLYSFNGGTTFTQKKAVTATFYSSEEFSGNIYFSRDGTTVEYSADGTTWNTPLSKNGYYLKKAHDRLYLAGADKSLYSWDGSAWSTEFTSKEWEVYGVAVQGRLLLLLCKDGADRVALRAYDGTVDFTIKIWEGVTVTTGVKNGVMVTRDNNTYFTLQTADKKRLTLYRFDGGVVKKVWTWIVGETAPSGVTYSGAYTLDTMGLAVIDGEVILNIKWDGSTDDFEVYNIGENDEINVLDLSNGTYGNANLNGDSVPIAIGRDVLYSGATASSNNSYMTQRQASTQKYRSSGSIILSVWDMDMFSLDKMFIGVKIYNATLPANATYTLQIRVDGGSWSSEISTNSTGVIGLNTQFFTSNVGKKIELRLNLSTSDKLNTPTIQDVVLQYILMPAAKWQWQFDVMLTRGLKRRDNTTETKSMEELMDHLKRSVVFIAADDSQWHMSPVVSFLDVDGTFYDPEESGADDLGVLIDDIEFLGPYAFGEGGPEYVARLKLIEA